MGREAAAVKALGTEDIQKTLAEQGAALDGERGATLVAVSTKDGSKLGELKLDSPPAWDAMAAAGGRLYLATVDGHVICLAP